MLASGALLEPLSALAAPLELAAEDDAFLDDLVRRGCRYFIEQVGAKTGQVLDRATSDNATGARDPRITSSIAATGFGLSALCIAERRRYQPRAAVVAQVRRTLDWHLNGNMPHEHGFFYHFNDVDMGGSFRGSEVSPIDTSILMCGVLTARAHFRTDPVIYELATKLYNRVEWPWMLNAPDDGRATFALGWRAGKFLPDRWDRYCELMMMYLLAIGSPTHPISAGSWNAWSRPRIQYAGFDYISDNDPLFVHQFSHAWFDFRTKRDQYANYFDNSVMATRAHVAFCLKQGKPYSENYWGISASDTAHGYRPWGGPSSSGQGYGNIDGSVVPNAAAGSLPFAPAACLRMLRALKEAYPRAWGRYGPCDAFHPDANWYDKDVLGIDLGIGVLMAENLRSGFLWSTFARNPEIPSAMRKAGFR
jgi:hypothetical protein